MRWKFLKHCPRLPTLFLVLLHFGSNAALGDGFAIKDQSPSAGGRSFAGAASTADDPSIIFYNPAGLTYLHGNQIFAATNLIGITMALKSSTGTLPTGLGGGAAGGPSQIDDVTSDAIIPVAYGMFDVSQNLKFGFGLNAPFGLSSNFDPTWQGRFHAVTSKLKNFNFNPVVAYRPFRWISLGAGLQISYAELRLTNAALTTTGEGFLDLKGDDIGFGWTFGAIFEPRLGTRLGVSYRSNIDHTLVGKARVTPGVGVPVDVGISGSLSLPETVRLGLSQDIGTRWSLHLGAAWRRWSRFDKQVINFDGPVAPLAGITSITKDRSWKDVWYLSAGATYKPTKNWTIQTGIGYDDTPVPDETRSPDIGGADGLNISIGTSYKINTNLDLTISYTHVFLDNAIINLSNPITGSLSAELETQIDILEIQGRYHF